MVENNLKEEVESRLKRIEELFNFEPSLSLPQYEQVMIDLYKEKDEVFQQIEKEKK